MAGKKQSRSPKPPEGGVTFERDGEYRFAYTPSDRVSLEWDGYVAVDESAADELVASDDDGPSAATEAQAAIAAARTK